MVGARYAADGSLTLEDESTVIDPAAGGLGILRQEGHDCNVVHIVSDQSANIDDTPCDASQHNTFACFRTCNGY